MNNIDKSSFADSFFQPEVKCGYFISEKMKKVWAVELDLLNKFVEVCEKYKLNYFMDGGTLLGAVRHGGFIPWDDDADVIMPRTDYNKLWDIAEDEFKEPYFFQTTLSEKCFFRTHAQLRNSLTTGFIDEDKEKNINKGIFIDIFALDYIPNNAYERKRFRKKIEWEKRMLIYQYNLKFSTLSVKSKLYYCLVHLFFKFYSPTSFFEHFNKKTLGKYENNKTNIVGDITLEWRANVQWSSEWFKEYVYLSFENLRLRAPTYYEEVLTRQYGDYMKLPDDVSDSSLRTHSHVTFEPEIPYKEYCRKTSDNGDESL